LRLFFSVFILCLFLSGPLSAGQKHPLPELKVKKKVLKNGFTVLVMEKPDTEKICCRLFYRVGAIDEKPGQTGLAHFFEHMMFKGTEQIGLKPGKLEQDQSFRQQLDQVATAIWREEDLKNQNFEKLKALRTKMKNLYREQRQETIIKDQIWEIYRRAGGMRMNAFTTEEFTCYIIDLPTTSLELFFWVEADRMHHLQMREFYSEREVVQGERRSRSKPRALAQMEISRLFYAGTAYSWPVIGWAEDIDRVTRQEAQAFYDNYYCPDNAVMVLVGGVKAEQAFDLAEEYFGCSTKKAVARPVRRADFQELSANVLYEKTIPAEAEVVLMYPFVNISHEDSNAGDLLAAVLNGKDGLLHQRLVKELKLCRSVRALSQTRQLVGAFSFRAVPRQGVTHEQVLKALENLVDEICNAPLEKERLEAVKTEDILDFYKGLRNNGRLALHLGYAELLLGSWQELIVTAKRTQAARVEDLLRVARKTFLNKNHFTVLIRDSRWMGKKNNKGNRKQP
jgi:predicted Zn-dependent peptidase